MHQRRYSSNEKARFQSVFILITVQLFAWLVVQSLREASILESGSPEPRDMVRR